MMPDVEDLADGDQLLSLQIVHHERVAEGFGELDDLFVGHFNVALLHVGDEIGKLLRCVRSSRLTLHSHLFNCILRYTDTLY